MDIKALEKRLKKLCDRGLLTKQVSSQVICLYCDNEEKRPLINRDLLKIENLNDEAEDFFIQLNILINEMLY